MDEQEILSVLKAHVARCQSNGSSGEANSAFGPPSRVDISRLDQASADLRRLGDGVGQLNPRNAGLVNRALQAFKKCLQRSMAWYTRSLHVYHNGVNQTIEQHAAAIASLQQQLLQLGGGLPERLQEALRAERRATQEQLAPYVQFFYEHEPVLDLGCGRGEFLELLKEAGILAYGVDSDHLACQEARSKFLKADQGDVLDHLTQVTDRSLGGIFCSRVIEYLPAHLQAKLVSLCAHKLKLGGLLVLETTNPDSDFPFGRNSHIDPSHLRAIYPEVLRSMVESGGFDNCSIWVLAPQPACLVAEPTGSGSVKLGQAISSAALSQAAFYAAIARR